MDSLGEELLCFSGRLNLEPLFGERASLDKFENAFTLLQGGLAGKVLLYPNGMPH